MADPAAKTINNPITSKITIIGTSHHFFLVFMNNQRSFKNSIMLVLIFVKAAEIYQKQSYR